MTGNFTKEFTASSKFFEEGGRPESERLAHESYNDLVPVLVGAAESFDRFGFAYGVEHVPDSVDPL